jgi:hypothetical protein
MEGKIESGENVIGTTKGKKRKKPFCIASLPSGPFTVC